MASIAPRGMCFWFPYPCRQEQESLTMKEELMKWESISGIILSVTFLDQMKCTDLLAKMNIVMFVQKWSWHNALQEQMTHLQKSTVYAFMFCNWRPLLHLYWRNFDHWDFGGSLLHGRCLHCRGGSYTYGQSKWFSLQPFCHKIRVHSHSGYTLTLFCYFLLYVG
jgi:hypothetical protein